jgi:putative tryptophan/tyrosine transport system substrate-binding protein
VRRREFIAGLGGAAAWPVMARAQQTEKIAKIGFIEAGSQQANQIFLDSFNDGLKALGWIEGKNISVLDRWVEARSERLPEIVNGLIRSGVDVLVTAAGPASVAAKQATSTIPIVAVGIPDPVGMGLINSLVRPGGNLTGFSSLSVELTAKRVQLLQEALPKASRVAVIWNPKDPGARLGESDAKGAAEKLGLSLLSIEVASSDDIERAFSALRTSKPDAVFVINDPLTVASRDQIVALANGLRLPIIAGFRLFAISGGLLSLGTSLPNDFKRAARLVDKILRGEKPADLPFEQPTQLELVINLKAAKVLGLELPQTLLARADEVIE